MSAQYPLIKAHLATVLLPTLPGWDSIVTIYPGPMDTSTPPRDPVTEVASYATVGYTGEGQSGSYVITQDDSGFQWAENGVLHCEITFEFGELGLEGIAALEPMMQAALDGLDNAVRADRRLGVLSQEGTSSFSVALAPVLTNEGSAMIARFVLTYLTVT